MKLRTILLGAGVAAVIAVGAVLLSSSSHGYQIRINLADADGLLTGSRVEIGGIGVGSVKSLQITPQDHALVTIGVDPADAPIGRNASVVIRPADLLGEKYLDLSVGNRTQPAPSGYTIPARHTQDATDFDQVIDVLAPAERDRLAVLIHETGVALFGRGVDVAKLLTALPPSLSDAKALIDQVDASNAQLESLITNADGVVGTLVSDQHSLSHFVATGSGALSATAAHTKGLEQTVAEAPGLLTRLDTTLARLDVAGAHLRPAARGLEQTAPALTETLTELPGFTTAALPTLAKVKAISPLLVGLGKQTAPVIARLKPTLVKLDTLAHATSSPVQSLDSSIDSLLGTMQNWARALQGKDGLSHQFRVSVAVPASLVSQLTASLGSGSTTAAKTPASRSENAGSGSGSGLVSGLGATVASLSQTLSSSTATLGSGVAGTVTKVANGVSATVTGVTSKLGLTHTATTATPTTTTTSSSSLQSLLGYLMGTGK